LLNVKGDSVTVIEGFETGRIDCRMMNKYVFTIFLLNESKSLAIVEPLNCSIGHDNILLSYTIFNVANWRVPLWQWFEPAERSCPEVKIDIGRT
jgi:hypothetical protein